jgi:hypothetical protein
MSFTCVDWKAILQDLSGPEEALSLVKVIIREFQDQELTEEIIYYALSLEESNDDDY